MNRIISNVAFAIALLVSGIITTACGKNPIGPSQPVGPVDGMVTFIEQTNVPCDPQSPAINHRFVLNGRDWPAGYRLSIVYMQQQGPTTWAATAKVPATNSQNPFLEIYIIDGCIMAPNGIWGVVSGTGLSAEPEGHPEYRVRLKDYPNGALFRFDPPFTILPWP